MKAGRRSVCLAAVCALLAVHLQASSAEEPVADLSRESLDNELQEFADDVSKLWDTRHTLAEFAPDGELGEGQTVKHQSHQRDASAPSFPDEELSPQKTQALQRLQLEEAKDYKLNPSVTWQGELGEMNDGDCKDEGDWAADCEHLAEHCGSSIVMKAKCRKTCGCGPKVDVFIPSLNNKGDHDHHSNVMHTNMKFLMVESYHAPLSARVAGNSTATIPLSGNSSKRV